MKIRLLLTLIFVSTLLSVRVFAQEITLTGTVVAQSNQVPLPGVSITIKGTRTGTVTDPNGKYSIVARAKDRIDISSIGYKTQSFIVDHRNILNVELQEDNGQLDEVVITALGISKEKKSLGYSVQAVKDGKISSANEQNLVNDLAGKIAGVQVTNSQGGIGSSSRIVIRGETSLSRNNQPLFIIDGVPVDNSQLKTSDSRRDYANAISDINSEDIESISVLKGPNAAALYGSRAGNGVILIKTKNGKGKKGVGVSVYSNTTFESVLELPKYQNTFGQGNGGQFSYVDGKGGGINDGIDESWGPRLDGQLIPQFYSNGKAVPFVAHPNNVKDYFETGHTLTNGVAFTGSGDAYDYRFSYNNSSQKGIYPNTDLTKHNFNFNNTYKILPNLTFSSNVNYVVNSSDNLPGLVGRAQSTMLQLTWFGRQVDMSELKKLYEASKGSNVPPINWNNSYYSNPYFVAYNNTSSLRRERTFGDVNLNYKFLDDFTANLRIGNDYYNDRRKTRIAYGTSGTPYGSYQETAYAFNENNIELTVDYNKKLSGDFSLDILGGGNLMAKYLETNDQKATKLAVAGLYTLNNNRDPATSSDTYEGSKKNSVFGSGQLSFRNYAFLNVTARNDWSSTLPVKNDSYFYPSVNGSVVLTDALDIKSDLLSYLKLRGGWAKVGNDADAYQLKDTYSFSTTPFGSYPLLTASDKSLNPNLKPEMLISTEFGAEFGFLNNNVKLDLSYYNTNSYNQIIPLDVSSTTGFTSKLSNAGKINNHGFEAQLSFAPVNINGFKWDVSTNFAINKSKVLKLDDAGLLASYVIDDYAINVLAPVGKAYGTLYGTAFKRNSAGQIVIDDSGLPEVSPDNKYFGSFQPKWTGGITNTFAFKGISLSFLVDARIGGSLYSGSYSTGLYTGILAQTMPGRDAAHGGVAYYYVGNDRTSTPVRLSGSTTPNGETVYHDGIIAKGVNEAGQVNTTIAPAEQYYKSLDNVNENSIFSATYVKLREVTLGFALPSQWVTRIGATSASFSLIGRNLWIIHKEVPNIDPETALNTGNGQGQETLALPTTRSYGFSLRLNF